MASSGHQRLLNFVTFPALLGLQQGLLGGVDHNDTGLAVHDDDIVVV
jgi:hypothetical protein